MYVRAEEARYSAPGRKARKRVLYFFLLRFRASEVVSPKRISMRIVFGRPIYVYRRCGCARAIFGFVYYDENLTFGSLLRFTTRLRVREFDVG